MGAKYTGELRILQKINKYEFAFEADILRDGPVQGGRWDFQNLEENYQTFAGRPVLIAYVNGKIGDGHNANERINPETGERYRSFTGSNAERIVGAISDDVSDLTLVSEGGHTWVRVKGRIWTTYAPELVDKIVRTGRMDVSIEAMVTEGTEENGVEIYTKWEGVGLTILGDDVDPAVPNANIRALAAMQEEFKEMKLRVASLVAEESTKKPQKDSEKKGMKNMRLSKQQLRELQAKFGEYTVLAAEQSENGVVVCLMDKSGTTAIYKMASIDESVVLDRVQTINAQAHFCAEGCEDVLVDACDMIDTLNAKATAAENEAECAKRELAEAKETIKQMEAAENARRLSAAKKAATDTLDKFNANRADKVETKVLEALNREIEAGKFTACEDENHVWTGDKAVEEKVLSLCATAVMEIDKARAAASKKTYVWERLASGVDDDGSVEALLARKGIKA